jgi:hypothetical protein
VIAPISRQKIDNGGMRADVTTISSVTGAQPIAAPFPGSNTSLGGPHAPEK